MRWLQSFLLLAFVNMPFVSLAQSEPSDRGPIGHLMPRSLTANEWAGLEVWQWIGGVIALVLSIVGGVMLGHVLTRGAMALIKRSSKTDVPLATEQKGLRLRGPIQAALVLGLFGIAMIFLALPEQALGLPANIYEVAWVLTGGWLFVRLVDLVAEYLAHRAQRIEGGRGRGIRTRIAIMRRVVHVIGITILVAIALMQVGPVRELGVSLLASAGVAGIVVGLAAQRSIGNLLAGIQLSFTQPLRVGDDVVVESLFGTVEEINLSYVVVKVWDQRRLIVPMTKLLESPFENWTRGSPELTGEVKVPVDFDTPMDVLREKLEAFVKGHELFDGRTFAVQVTDVRDRIAEVRVLVSACGAGNLFNLRCAVREFLLTTLREMEGGAYLPRIRFGLAQPEQPATNGATSDA